MWYIREKNSSQLKWKVNKCELTPKIVTLKWLVSLATSVIGDWKNASDDIFTVKIAWNIILICNCISVENFHDVLYDDVLSII